MNSPSKYDAQSQFRVQRHITPDVIGELLYPSFNTIVPGFIETGLFGLCFLEMQHQRQLLETFYNLLSFTFKT